MRPALARVLDRDHNPTEWTLEMWQAHSTQLEKRVSALENIIANMSSVTRTQTMLMIQAERSKGACLV